MHYLTDSEALSLLEVAYREDRLFHLAVLVSLGHALRITEMRKLAVSDVDGLYLRVNGLKGGEKKLEPLYGSGNPLFNELALGIHAHGIRSAGKTLLFGLSRQAWDKKMRQYCQLAGIPAVKQHWHVLRHTTAMMTFKRTTSLGSVKNVLRHCSWSSSLVYLNETDTQRGYDAVRAGLQAMAQKTSAPA